MELTCRRRLAYGELFLPTQHIGGVCGSLELRQNGQCHQVCPWARTRLYRYIGARNGNETHRRLDGLALEMSGDIFTKPVMSVLGSP